MKQSGIGVAPGQAIQVIHSHAFDNSLQLKIAVTPTVMTTSHAARRRFRPRERTCYFQDEINLRHLPPENDYRLPIVKRIFHLPV